MMSMSAEDDVLNEDEMMETLLSEGDHDATFISDFRECSFGGDSE